jgi:hypothetical protein
VHFTFTFTFITIRLLHVSVMQPPSVKHYTIIAATERDHCSKVYQEFYYFVLHVTLFRYNVLVFTVFINMTAGIT